MPTDSSTPPRWALKFFRWYCNPHLVESIEGDLEERFIENIEKKGLFRAKVQYWLDVVKFMNRYTMRKSKHRKAGIADLFLMTLQNSIRILLKHRKYSFINITGLTLGIAVSLFIFNSLIKRTLF